MAEATVIKTPQSIRGLTRVGLASLKDDMTAYDTLKMLEKAAEITVEWTQNVTHSARGLNPAALQTYSPRVGKGKLIIDGLSKTDMLEFFNGKPLTNGGVSFGNMFNKTKWFGIYAEKSNDEQVQVNNFYKCMLYPPKVYSGVSIPSDNAEAATVEIEFDAFHIIIKKADGTFTPITDTEFNSVDDSAKWSEIYEKISIPTLSGTTDAF